MRVDPNAAQHALAAYRSATPAKTASNGTPTPGAAPIAQQGDGATISTHGQERARALDAVRSAPPVRQDVVAHIKSQVQNGRYTVDHDKLAQGIVRSGALG